MARTPGIVILGHERDPFERTAYLLTELAILWRREGWRVTLARGPGRWIDADAAILHVDLTVVPDHYLEFVWKYPVAINGRVADISKRRISRNLVQRDGAYQGPVLVKTDANHGGWKESRLTGKQLLCIAPDNYPIFPTVEDVPSWVWKHPDLVVERFLPERHNELYCLRTWMFLGDQETHSLSHSKQPIVKSSNVVHREPLGEVPAELRQMRLDLGFDYGKFDYAIVDGRVVLYDANLTPTLDNVRSALAPRLPLLAQGIRTFLKP